MTNAVAIASLVVSVMVAVVVPLVSYRLALRQEQTRWLREQRAQVYMDLLTEAYAEQQWDQYRRVDTETKERFGRDFIDLRLPPDERARLGTRASLFGSSTVNKLFNLLSAELFWGMATGPRSEGEATQTRVRVGRIADELQRVTRLEMRANQLLPNVHSDLLNEPHPAERESRRYFIELQKREEEIRRRMMNDPEFLRSAGVSPESQPDQDQDQESPD